MDLVFDPVETRVLACLIEKEITTPEYYPLTLNALINACNQKSNRDPVVSFDEDTVAEAIDRLRERRMVTVLTGGSNRVPKYGHRVQDTLNLGRRELALLCELMLRGPQTVGELRDRAGRMQRFSDIEETEACLRSLAEHPGGALATELPRQPGRKEPRFAHLLSGLPEHAPGPDALIQSRDREGAVVMGSQDMRDRIAQLESRIAELESQFARFKQQFE